jgi:hypothetical protein
MAAPKPWETSMPMSNQPIASSFDTLNNGFMPTIDQAYVFFKNYTFSFKFHH